MLPHLEGQEPNYRKQSEIDSELLGTSFLPDKEMFQVGSWRERKANDNIATKSISKLIWYLILPGLAVDDL